MTSSMMSSPNELRNDHQWDIWRYWNMMLWENGERKWNFGLLVKTKKCMLVKTFLYVGENINIQFHSYSPASRTMIHGALGAACWWKFCNNIQVFRQHTFFNNISRKLIHLYRDCWYLRILSRILSRNFCDFSDFSCDFSEIFEIIFEFELFVLANAFRLYPFPVMFSRFAKFASFLNFENCSAKSVIPFDVPRRMTHIIYVMTHESYIAERNLWAWNQTEIFLVHQDSQLPNWWLWLHFSF